MFFISLFLHVSDFKIIFHHQIISKFLQNLAKSVYLLCHLNSHGLSKMIITEAIYLPYSVSHLVANWSQRLPQNQNKNWPHKTRQVKAIMTSLDFRNKTINFGFL